VTHENSLAALKKHQFKPGQSGNPGGQVAWRKALLDTVGDGELYWRLLAVIASGADLSIETRWRLNTRGKLEMEFLEEPKKLEVTVNHALKATEMLLDRAFGKAIQAIITTGMTREEQTQLMGFDAIAALNEEDRDALKRIAQKLALGGRADGQPEAIDTTSTEDPDGGEGGKAPVHRGVPEERDEVPDADPPEERPPDGSREGPSG
jgi:hypothetical protein